MAATTFEIDVRQLEGLAERLTRLNGEQLQAMNVRVVNVVAERSEDFLRNYVLSDVNMQEAYYRAKSGRTEAKAGGGVAEATIFALASTKSDRRARLARYDPQQLVRSVKNETRSKGDAKRGIAKGSRAAGLSVEVMDGKRERMPGAYLMPLRRGRAAGSWDGAVGLFTRSRDGKVTQHRLGPAVYQVFRHARDEHTQRITSDLEATLLREADEILHGVFE